MSTPMNTAQNKFGALEINVLYAAKELKGIGARSTRWQVIEALVKASEGTVTRLAEGRTGVLMLISVPTAPNSGMLYLYDEQTRSIFMLEFSKMESLASHAFDQVIEGYALNTFLNVERRQRNNRRRRRRHHGTKAISKPQTYVVYNPATAAPQIVVA